VFDNDRLLPYVEAHGFRPTNGQPIGDGPVQDNAALYGGALLGVTKVPTGSARKRLSTGEYDFGASVDISRQFGIWGPFVTVGYLNLGQPAGFTLYNTTSVSAGTSLVLSDNLVAVASYDYDSADSPLVPAGHELSGSLSWMRDDHITLMGYGTVGLSAGSPDLGVGFLISYGLK